MKTSLHCGRADWSRHWGELTWHEQQTLEALSELEGFGDDRQDWRTAVQTAVLALSLRMDGKPPGEDEVRALLTNTMRLLSRDDEPEEDVYISPNAAAAMFGGLGR